MNENFKLIEIIYNVNFKFLKDIQDSGTLKVSMRSFIFSGVGTIV